MKHCVTSKSIEQQNQLNIISKVEAGRISRADIAKQTGLSRTTVSNATQRLMELGLIRECPLQDAAPSRGRPGTPLALTEDRWFAAGATLIDSEAIFVLLRLDGSIAYRATLPLQDAGPEAYLDVLVKGFRLLIRHCPGKLLPCLGVGSPGMIQDGKIVYASDMGWTDVDISGRLLNTLQLPCEVINRHWASAIAEHRLSRTGSMIYVGISTGIAAAIIVDGKLFTGAYHSAGEIGHTVVNPDGPLCVCGRRGCLHSISSETFIVSSLEGYYKKNPRGLFPEDPLWLALCTEKRLCIETICAAAQAGHPLAEEALDRSAQYLGLSISNLTSMFNPERVVLGGSLVDHGGESFTQHIIESVQRYSSADIMGAVVFSRWELGRLSGAMGAARLVLDKKIELAAQTD